MRTAVKPTLLTAIVATIMVAGCAPQPKAVPAATPEELKQITEVTNRVVSLANSLKEGSESATRDAIRQSIVAVTAARPRYRQHAEAILTIKNAEVLACIDSHSIEFMDLETVLARFDEAVQTQNDVKATGRKNLLQIMAMRASACAAQGSVMLIAGEKRPEVLEHAAVLISEIYAIAVTMRPASGLSMGPLLKDQIRLYEDIAAKLGPKHEIPVVTDALPKLRETVAMLDKNGLAIVKPPVP